MERVEIEWNSAVRDSELCRYRRNASYIQNNNTGSRVYITHRFDRVITGILKLLKIIGGNAML